MKKCIVIPDSFKGTMSSQQVCEIVSEEIRNRYPKCEIYGIPVTDGGEGTTDCFLQYLGAEKVYVEARDAYMESRKVYYARIGTLAIIESAMVVGLPLVEGRLNPLLTTTYGVGEMILHAVKSGCKEIILGLGGSCTNDGGTGMASALGTVFLNQYGESFVPTGNTLCQIRTIKNQITKELLNGVNIVAMCDVDNPLYGVTGAAYVYAPQKGATLEMVQILDQNLRHLDSCMKYDLGYNVATEKGAGAAGGMGAGVIALLNGVLRSGIQTVLDQIHFDLLLDGTDLVITGEGKVDSQSLSGKVIMGIAERTRVKNIPLIVLTGCIEDGAEIACDHGVTAIISINTKAEEYEVSRYNSTENLRFTTRMLMRVLQIGKG